MAIEKERIIEAKVADVWHAWTTSDGAQTFFAPKADIDLRPGGKYEILFFPENPRGTRGAEGLHVLSFIPERMLAFEWNAPPQYPNVRHERTWVVIETYPLPEDRTQVRLTHLGWRPGDEWDQVHSYFMGAWDVVLGRLARRFTHGPIDWEDPWRPEGHPTNIPSVANAGKQSPSEPIGFLSAALLVSKDPKRLFHFYRDVIGVPLVEENHGELSSHYGCTLGDLHFAIHPIENFVDTRSEVGSVKLAFNTFDIHALADRFERNDVKLLYPIRDTGFFLSTAVLDPDGNLIEFTELCSDWFQHLEERKSQGLDVVKRWKEHQLQQEV